MKIISKTLRLLPILVLVLGLVGCSDDDDNTVIQLQNAVDIALADSELTSLVAALQRADLVDAVRDLEDATILAPTNEAFDAFLGGTPLDQVPVDELRRLLLNHVINERISSAGITSEGNGYRKTLADGPDESNLSIYFAFDEDSTIVTFNGQSDVENADIFASNGVIHKVDAVIDLPSIETFASSNPALSTLVTVLGLGDSNGTDPVGWIDAVSASDPAVIENAPFPLTVFAPTNAAFESLLDELEITLNDIDANTADAVLAMHVVGEANVESDELGTLEGSIPTLGGNLMLDGTVITDGLDREINILLAEGLVDIQGVNGVVHVIDRVIRPTE